VVGLVCWSDFGMCPCGSWSRLQGNHLGRVVCVATLDPVLFNELIFGLGFLVSTHIVTRLLNLMNLTCRLLSAVKL
jgi:hypothetical protein